MTFLSHVVSEANASVSWVKPAVLATDVTLWTPKFVPCLLSLFAAHATEDLVHHIPSVCIKLVFLV